MGISEGKILEIGTVFQSKLNKNKIWSKFKKIGSSYPHGITYWDKKGLGKLYPTCVYQVEHELRPIYSFKI